MDLKVMRVMRDEINELNIEINKLESELKKKIQERDNKRVDLKTAVLINGKDNLPDNSIKEIVRVERVEILVV